MILKMARNYRLWNTGLWKFYVNGWNQSHGARYACLEIWAWSGVQSSAEWCQVTSLGTIIGLFCLVPSDVTWHHSAKEFSKLSCALHITLRFPDKHTLLHDFVHSRNSMYSLLRSVFPLTVALRSIAPSTEWRKKEMSPTPSKIWNHDMRSFTPQACTLLLCHNHCNRCPN